MAGGCPTVVTVAGIRASGKQSRSLGNVALKFIRDSHEDPPGTASQPNGVDLFDEDPYEIMTLSKTKGVDYSLVLPFQPWSWRAMLNGMDDATLERIVGEGIVGIACKPIHHHYDHKRQHAARTLGRPFPAEAPVPVWDFVVTRADRTAVRFHPNLKSKKIEIKDLSAEVLRDGPRRGKGNSDGPGTYRRMLDLSYDEKGSFEKGVVAQAPASSSSAVAEELSEVWDDAVSDCGGTALAEDPRKRDAPAEESKWDVMD